MNRKILFIFLLPTFAFAQLSSNIQSLSREFWDWRTMTQPSTMDDIQRVERPDNWKPDFSPEALIRTNELYNSFSKRLKELDRTGWSRTDSVDFLCLRSAVERVNWEINVLRIPFTNPDFYIQQTLGALYERLIVPESFNSVHVNNLISILESFPGNLSSARKNLSDPSAQFALIALENLKDIGNKLIRVKEEIKKQTDNKFDLGLEKSFSGAISALEDYRKWLNEKLPAMKERVNIGREAYSYFLQNVALIPYSPEKILEYGRMEFNRSALFESLEKSKNKNKPAPKIFNTIEEEIKQVELDENAIREFLVKNEIMTVPEWLKHYTFRKTPGYLAPLTFIGEADDFTSEMRLNQNAVRYTVEPDTNLPFFPLSIARDPRPIIVHEGIPGHYFQLAISWKNPNPVRRRFVDSGSNEGIGFYVEEMLLQSGLFDERPYAKEIIYSFMRLRALRVEADIQLALGNFTIDEAADYLAKSVPLDKSSAVESAYFYAYNPGQAISYQIGKIQIVQFLSDARIKLGTKFSLKDFHDYLMLNGNVPISLLRWEYLGLRDEINYLFENL